MRCSWLEALNFSRVGNVEELAGRLMEDILGVRNDDGEGRI
jgi:hypothetical protein